MLQQNAEQRQPYSVHDAKSKSPRARTVVLVVIALMLSCFYLRFAWGRYQDMRASDTIDLAQSLETLLPIDHILKLSEEAEAPGSPDYSLVKNRLIRLVQTTNSIHYAYLAVERDGRVSVLVDSNTDDTSSGYSPLGNMKQELSDSSWVPFQTERIVLTKPITNEWGTWIRALVPVKHPKGGRVVAILGLSYSASEWNSALWKRMIPDVIVMISLLVLFCALLWVWTQHALLKEKSRKLAFNEQLYRNLFEQAPIGITLNHYQSRAMRYELKSVNPMAERILGRNIHDLSSTSWTQVTHPEDLPAELAQFERFIHGEIDGYSIEKRILKPDGSSAWVNVTVSSFLGSSISDVTYLCLFEDISVRKAMEGSLKESERSKSVFLSHLPGMAYRSKYDRNWTLEFVSEGCRALTGYDPESLIGNRDLSYNDMLSEEHQRLLWNELARALAQKKDFRAEYDLVTKNGEHKWVLELGQGIYDADGNVEALEGVVLDISEQKKKEHQITYLREHDFLTGLYNRSYMDQEKKRMDGPEFLPLSIAICDIDGLRMINDAYGHAKGDQLISESARLLQNCCRLHDVAGRISGGEFMLLLPCTDGEAAHRLVQEIQETIDSYNRTRNEPLYEISLSIGYGTKDTEGQSIEEAMKTAEEYLRSKKLLNQNSSYSAIVSSIMATLYAKSQETEEHGQRLGQFCQMIGERLGLEQKGLDDLQLFSKLHDIGKIGIDDRILNKPGKLTEDEWKEMRQHPEIGYRIALAAPQLEHIAEYILHHHERWDGTGYPAGRKGEEIPLPSRVLAIADAYDAMTEDRVYRRALSIEAATREINRCAGTQFDPEIARLFSEFILAQEARKRTDG